MPTSTINLYKETGLQPEKNFIIDDFSQWLSSYLYKTISTFQWIKHNLTLSIKIDWDQKYMDSGSEVGIDVDYISIKNSERAGNLNQYPSNTYFYFVVDKQWRSEKTVELFLRMDTLNTFKWNTDYNVDKRTLVIREHKDRVKKDKGNTVFNRLVDLKSEGIIAPLYKKSQDTLYKQNDPNTWCMLYKNKNAYNQSHPEEFLNDNPVDVFLTPKDEMKISYSGSDGTLTGLTIGEYYYLSNYILELDGVEYSLPQGFYSYWEIYVDTTSFEVSAWYCDEIDFQGVVSRITVDVTGVSQIKIKNAPAQLTLYHSNSSIGNWGYYGGGTAQIVNTGTTTSYESISVTNIDRTDSRNIKLIDFPYPPCDTYLLSGALTLPTNEWEYSAGDKLFKMRDTSNVSSLSYDMIMRKGKWTSTDPIFNPKSIFYLNKTISSCTNEDVRDDSFESKIYHSDFYQDKFVYDSFYYIFRNEQFDLTYLWNANNTITTPVTYVVSRNITSKFMFMFRTWGLKYATSDYDNIVLVARNNEEVLYSSQYLNYLRAGYNYDLKAKERSETAGGIGLATSITSTLLGIVGGLASGNYAMAGISAVVGGMSIASQSVSYANSLAQNEQNIQKQLDQAQRQAVSVSSVEDVDLLSAYTGGNKAKVINYQVSPLMKQALLDMFYYAGYSTNEQKVPDVTTRYWFNFLQCELVINDTKNLKDEYINDIKTRFKEGCTFFHKHIIDDSPAWDVAQVKENYEKWILS